MHCGIQNQLFFCLTAFLHSLWVKKSKKWQQPVPDHFDGNENFFSELCFLDNGFKNQQWTANFFGTDSALKGLPLNSKAASGYFGQCLGLDRKNRP